MKKQITVANLMESFGLSPLNDKGDFERVIAGSYVSYAGLALAGYLDHIQEYRVTLLGDSELGYLSQLDQTARIKRWRAFARIENVPCAITSHPGRVPQWAIDVAEEEELPLLSSSLPPRALMPRLIDFLRHELAPTKHMHGVAIDVYGMGLMLIGKSGVGKSECALELVKRGHRLISDDVVILKKISDEHLFAVCPQQLRHHMELRGIGLVDVRSLFGVGAISEGKNVDLVIRFEEASRGRVYERLGLEQRFLTILGVEVPMLVIPVTEGKNLSIVIEAAAMNQHLRMLGINSARELTDQVFRRLNPTMKELPK